MSRNEPQTTLHSYLPIRVCMTVIVIVMLVIVVLMFVIVVMPA